MSDMEQLIERLNDQIRRPSPEDVDDIQKQIQYLQRDFAGWSHGLELLKSNEPLMRFYGALTLTIKINADWYAISLGRVPNRSD